MDTDVISIIRKKLRQKADEKTKNSFKRFFKEKVKYHGVKTALVISIAKEYFKQIKDKDKAEIYFLCEEFLKSGYCEEAWIAANWVYWYGNIEKKDFFIYERWINKYIDNWAECDTFCNHAVGSLIEKFPDILKKIKKWAKSENLWVRRASAVSLVVPAKKGKFLDEIFEIADILLTDKENMVQKGYGWMLKVTSQVHQKEVFAYVLKHRNIMPRTALRYAIEKMPHSLKARAMER